MKTGNRVNFEIFLRNRFDLSDKFYKLRNIDYLIRRQTSLKILEKTEYFGRDLCLFFDLFKEGKQNENR